MSYSDDLKVLRKKTAKARDRRGLSNRQVGLRSETTMLNQRRFIFVGLEQAAEWRRIADRAGREFSYQQARRALQWAREHRLLTERPEYLERRAA